MHKTNVGRDFYVARYVKNVNDFVQFRTKLSLADLRVVLCAIANANYEKVQVYLNANFHFFELLLKTQTIVAIPISIL